jgi:AmiR/NasT family two-component response regulator
VVIEQAKGIVAHVGNLDMAQAFVALRQYARNHNQRLTQVANAVVGRLLPVRQLLDEAGVPLPGR